MSDMDRFGQPQAIPTSSSNSIAATAPGVGPAILDRISKFYSDHPTLVKVLGTIAVAQLARSMTRR